MNLLQLLKQNSIQRTIYVSGTNDCKLINKIVARTTAVAATNDTQPNNQPDPIKPFKDLPGPKRIASLWDIFKNKRYYLHRSHELFTYYSKQYGSIFKCRIGAVDLVYVSKPEDVAKVFQAEGQYANRGQMLASPWVIYREQSKKPKGVLIG